MKLVKGVRKELHLGQCCIDCFLLSDGTKAISIHSLKKITKGLNYKDDYDLLEVKELNYSCPSIKVLENESDIILAIDKKEFVQILLQEATRTYDPFIISILSALAELGIEKTRGS